ncbi:MAG: hypothetical protein NT124_05305 [Candidatus Dependentiae bacterium]|nr:hypothetical protein [Candidatus Dependentiae bacterium]
MEQRGFKEEHAVLHHLSHIAPQMLKLRDQDNLTEFVLHELCCQKGFNFEKAAYFVDNPDFNCLKGVAGFSRAEEYVHNTSIWESPEAFSVHMCQAQFNQKVRTINKVSVRKSSIDDALLVKEMAQDLGFKEYGFYSWDMKHDNHSIFLFERSSNEIPSDEHVRNGISLLSFCPLF